MLLEVKPWDDETDMKKLEEAVRSVQMPGLTWGACKSKKHNLNLLFSQKNCFICFRFDVRILLQRNWYRLVTG